MIIDLDLADLVASISSLDSLMEKGKEGKKLLDEEDYEEMDQI